MDVVLPKPGTYVVAVSGGVDSMVLLDLLRQQEDLHLVVAHLDHGMRMDSGDDRRLVEAIAKGLGLPFESKQANLGAGTSEAAARKHRYEFLEAVTADHGADAIITAHHQDDVLETAIINMLRGSGRKGLTSLKNRPGVVRPLLRVPKSELIEYAKDQGLRWREDSTNADDVYLRNYVRHRLLTRFDKEGRAKLLKIVTGLQATNAELDTLLVKQLGLKAADGKLDRSWFNLLPHTTAREVLASWLRTHNMRGFNTPTLERLVVAAKVAPAGKRFSIAGGHQLVVHKDYLALKVLER
ncbi:tRNA lysidine(34) synthetase TilS [Candidatus Saccharibacteria bacterium CG_4_10_14_0_2_um_filter_52_9]|nr:MAG: tRNA lysidine(34) synthetase TilS [Candidatus Saccharibacteria bacterium CG_4_10_14_0_2_um_filter_52_9]